MSDQSSRKALRAQYKESRPEAGVYRIVNRETNKALLGSTPNLAGVRNKLAFAQSTNSPGALDWRLGDDIRRFGLSAFAFEVVEVWETKPEMSAADIRADLAALEALVREATDPATLY